MGLSTNEVDAVITEQATKILVAMIESGARFNASTAENNVDKVVEAYKKIHDVVKRNFSE
jgi:hypothetical protein